MKKKNSLIITAIAAVIIGIGLVFLPNDDQKVIVNGELMMEIEVDGLPSIFRILVSEENYQKVLDGTQPDSATLLLKPENNHLYLQVRDSVIIQNTVVVYPIFTAAAYEEPGFYTYYRGECDESCLTKEVKGRDEYRLFYNTSGIGIQVLNLLGYKFITDLEIHKNPEVLDEFDKVIILHNEYVTRSEFDAITNHPNVVYLYPNALYAEVEFNEDDNTIKLIRGHDYPESQILNGFDWEFDNTHPYEFDNECENWEFYEIDNGIMLNCYPELTILGDLEMLTELKFIGVFDENES